MATKYVSSLTGPEMDAALIDTAYHNSEAYAVGTRNGVEVGSGDVTYHNNSKYYAEQVYGYTDRAEDAAARAEAAVPAGTAGAVFFDRAQSLTTAQQSQARANIMAGGSNDNLLDNWYFVGGGSQLGDGIFPINQRGQTSYTSYGWALDRWICGGNASVTLTQSGVTVASSAYDNNFLQRIEPNLYNALVGKTVTLSILATSLSGAWNVGLGNIVLAQFTNAGMLTVTATVQTQAQDLLKIISFAGEANSSITIAAIKLELGTYSTLANDVRPDFGKELEKCKRYFQRVIQPQGYTASVGFGMVGAASNILRTTIPLSSPLRNAASITATATNTGQIFVWGNGSYYSVTGVTSRTVLNGNAIVDITVNGTLENYKTYNLILNNADAYIDLSAEL